MTAAEAACGALAQQLVQARAERAAGLIIGLTAWSHGTGVTHVCKALAASMVETAGGDVLIVSGRALANGWVDDSRAIRSRATGMRPGVWLLEPSEGIGPVNGGGPGIVALASGLRQEFPLTIVDCSPLKISSEALAASAAADAMILVVQADDTPLHVIRTARQMIEQAKGNFYGLILNKRQYPVPRILYQSLGGA